MRKIIFIALCIGMGIQAMGQDRIITLENDTINARITKIKKGMVHFQFMKGNELRKTLLPISDIENYEKGFYETPEVPKKAKVKSYLESKRFQIGTQVGYAFRTAKIADIIDDSSFRQHLKNLSSGVNIGLDAHYFINETIGLGIKYNTFRSKATLREANLVSRTNITFIGPSIMTKLLSANKKNALILSSSLGYIALKGQSTFGQAPAIVSKGSSVGAAIDIGYDFGINDFLSFYIGTSWTTGAISRIETSDGFTTQTEDLPEPEGLSRISISGGLRFSL